MILTRIAPDVTQTTFRPLASPHLVASPHQVGPVADKFGSTYDFADGVLVLRRQVRAPSIRRGDPNTRPASDGLGGIFMPRRR